jgi:hypothetical protein
MPDIQITISKSQVSEGTLTDQDATPSTGEKKPSKSEKGKTNTTQKAVNGALIQVGKQMISQGINQYSNLTGDYTTAETINFITTLGADIATVAAAGPAGAVYVAGKYAIQLATSSINQFRKEQEHAINLQRLGDISVKGSRY